MLTVIYKTNFTHQDTAFFSSLLRFAPGVEFGLCYKLTYALNKENTNSKMFKEIKKKQTCVHSKLIFLEFVLFTMWVVQTKSIIWRRNQTVLFNNILIMHFVFKIYFEYFYFVNKVKICNFRKRTRLHKKII